MADGWGQQRTRPRASSNRTRASDRHYSVARVVVGVGCGSGTCHGICAAATGGGGDGRGLGGHTQLRRVLEKSAEGGVSQYSRVGWVMDTVGVDWCNV